MNNRGRFPDPSLRHLLSHAAEGEGEATSVLPSFVCTLTKTSHE